MSEAEFLRLRRLNPNLMRQKEPDRRFEIIFKELKSGKQGYLVDLDLVDHQAKDKRLAAPQRFRGQFQLPPVKLDRTGGTVLPENMTLVLKVRSGNQEMELRQMGLWNDPERQWTAVQGPAPGRRFVPSAEIPAADSPDGIATERLSAASKLALDGKFDDAQKAYDKIIADYPGTIWEEMAKFGVSKMVDMKKGRAKVEAMKKGQAKVKEPR